MKTSSRIAACIALLLLSVGVSAQVQTVTDMAGRKVTMPKQIHKIYCMNPACAMMIYTVAPERLMSWSLGLTEKERSYLAAPYNQLNGPGPMGDTTQSNVEQLIRMHPDVIMFLNDPTDRSGVDRMNQLQAQTGIPTYEIDMRLRSTPAVYEHLGAVLGVEKRAAILAKYCRETFAQVDAKVRTIPMDKRPRVYYAAGANGLQTFFEGAPHAEAISFAGGYNVARLSTPQKGQAAGGQSLSHMAMSQSRGQVSIEQLLAWNPQVIVVASARNVVGDRFYKDTIWNDPLWKSLPAVRNHAVYAIPAYPFNWVSPPASINRVLGIKWLASLLHPDLFHYDMGKEARQFYSLFYYHHLTDAELKELLQQ